MSKKQLYDYQKIIVDKTLNTTDNILIKLPTGGGKTLISSEIIRYLIAWGIFKQVLFVAPKIVLMNQTIKAFQEESLNPHKIHGTNKYNINHRLFVSTIHTASKKKDLNVDVIIIDEVHYGFDGKMFKNLIENNPNARIIGLSATPYTQEGKKIKGFTYIDDIDVKYLMQNDFLVQKLRQYELVKQDLSGIALYAGDYNQKQLSHVVCNKNTIVEIIETTSSFISKSKKTIVFAVDIMHAELLTKAYQDAGFIAKALHSKMNKDENLEPMEIGEEIENFRIGSTKILVSVLMLTTGFDVPDTDCAVIARPTKSQNLYKQMVGRILRKSTNKKEAVLLDCGNVIQNLGMPLSPITEVGTYNTRNTDQRCPRCNSLNIKLVKEDKEVYWVCIDCGYKKDVKNSVFTCKQCLEVHSYDSNFTFKKDEFILNCTCGYKTVISKYSNEKLVEIIDDNDYLKYNNPEPMKKSIVIEPEKEEATEKIISTVNDVVNCIAEEIKIYSDSLASFYDIFKVKKCDIDRKYAVLGLLDDKEKQIYLTEYEIIYMAILNNDYNNFIVSVDNINAGDFTSIEVFRMYEEWLSQVKWQQIKKGAKHSFKEDYKMEFLERCNTDNRYKVLDKLIQLEYFNLSEIMSIAYHNNLDKLTKYHLKKYSIKTLTFPIFDSCFEYRDCFTESINKKYFDNFSSIIQAVDIGESVDILSFMEGKDSQKYIYYVTDLLMYFNSFFSKRDIKVLLYGKEVRLHYWPYEESYNYLLKQNINSFKKWFEFKESDENIFNIPKYPNIMYPDKWQGWFHWLNINANNIILDDIKALYEKEFKDNSSFLMYDKDIVKIESLQEMIIEYPKPKKSESALNNYISFNKAREYVRSLNLKSKKAWDKYKVSSKIPSDIPVEPHVIYSNNGWINTDDWIGKNIEEKKVHNQKIKLSDYWKESKRKLLSQIKTKKSTDSKNLENTIIRDFDRIESKVLDNKALSRIEKEKSISNLESYYTDKLKFIL